MSSGCGFLGFSPAIGHLILLIKVTIEDHDQLINWLNQAT
uniref:Uncharacterized protein n=1 Tax=Anguilla anguilla TaxID=7936 RepID=A0A0E9S209_ANGAN